MPVLAVGSGLAAADARRAAADDRLLQGRALLRGGAGASGRLCRRRPSSRPALTLAYIRQILVGDLPRPRSRTPATGPHRPLSRPIVVLAMLSVAGGVIVGAVCVRSPRMPRPCTQARAVELAPAYHLDLRAENVMALAAWLLGGSSCSPDRVESVVCAVSPGSATARARDALYRVMLGVILGLQPHSRSRGPRPAGQPRLGARPDGVLTARFAVYADRRRVPSWARGLARTSGSAQSSVRLAVLAGIAVAWRPPR